MLLLWDDVRIVRTAYADQWEHADVLLDVGGVYDPADGRFDHHGHTVIPEPYQGRRAPFATAGLVWYSYGPLLCRRILECCPQSSWHAYAASQPELVLEQILIELSDAMDEEIIALVDAWDVGMHPPRSLLRQVIPLQWLLPFLEFEQAIEAMGKAFMQRLVTLAEIVADEALLAEELWDNGPCEFFTWNDRLTVIAPANRHVEVTAARKFAERVFRLPLTAVVGSVRGGQKWGAFFVDPLPPNLRVPDDLEYPAGRRVVFHRSQQRILEFVKACSDLPLPAWRTL